MSLWTTTEESVKKMLQGWGRPVQQVTIVPPGGGPAAIPATLTRRDVIIDADAARLPRAMQGARADALTFQLRDPQSAAKLAAVCAPLAMSTWRSAPLPEDELLRETMLELDQVRAEAHLRRVDPNVRLLLPTVATWLARAPIVGSDDAVAYQLLTGVCPRADALVLPTAATERIKTALVDYLGAGAMRQFVSQWRSLLAAGDQRSVVQECAATWIELAETHLPGYLDRAGSPVLLAVAARHATADLEQIETDEIARIARLRTELDDTGDLERPDAVLDPDHRPGGAGTGLPANLGLRHRSPTDDDVQLRRDLREALAVARARQIATAAHPSSTPSGRADTRELVRMAAQRHNGTAITATPWTRHIPEIDDEPDILVAAVLDASASMSPWMASAAPLMWAIACAAHDLGGGAAVWGFAGEVFEIIRGGSAPHLVPQLPDSRAGSTGYAAAVAAACQAVELTSRKGARLLVVLTDGQLHDPEEARRLQRALADVTASGATVLWALTGSTVDAIVPDQVTIAQGVTPNRFADIARTVLLNTVRTT